MVDAPPIGRHRGDRRVLRAIEVEDTVSSTGRHRASNDSWRWRLFWRPFVRPRLRQFSIRFIGLVAIAFLLALLSNSTIVAACVLGYLIGSLYLTSFTGYGQWLIRRHPIMTYVSIGTFIVSFVLFMNRIGDQKYSQLPVLKLPAFPEDLNGFRRKECTHANKQYTEMLLMNESNANAIIETLRQRFESEPLAANEEFVEKFSIIIAARDEDPWLTKTIKFTLQNTPASVVHEIIVVDDASTNPQADLLNAELSSNEKRFVKVIRFDTKQDP
eukprot:Gregarina_sp_Poly_1__5329@NODE_2819_length_1682_cov_46_003715_g1777_i0_p1_GENE_NODE_2819_length_1682_cov_46_003715_g1777_i0NODE_2819_length_1682_cov_46_003715_g1777_i0_p1_ORF_typecomplete_len290_score28_35Glycos_transf_2/PF00535_26/3_6e05Glyco_tranf_2_3/PF13641_6/4_7e05DUF1761/PF08570_10/0_13FtsK_4TM/PF13491_6/0_32DUF1700/PF08006_11/0_21DUF1700/PF08006_11/4_8e03DUF2705/PF10920_8/1_4CPBP/PF02517_16/1_9_NODE_2819_length_1682_cov_46_003715_g1777_i08131628